VLVGGAASREELVASLVAAPFEPGAGLVRGLHPYDEPGGSCLRLDLDGRYPDGTPVTASDVAAAWSESLLAPGSTLRWLLAPVEGVAAYREGTEATVSGLRPDGERLTVCAEGEAPDLASRLAHPALAFMRRGPQGVEGPGPFVEGGGLFPANPAHTAAGPRLDAVRLVEGALDPALLFDLDEVDVALVHGRTVEEIRAAEPPPAELQRVPAWDEVWFLWLSGSHRWVNDPAFRSWIANRIDRAGLARFLYADHAAPAFSLDADGPRAPLWAPPPHGRPFAGASRPRLELFLRQGDSEGARIAARLREELGLAGVELGVRAVGRDALREALGRDEPALTLLAHRPGSQDPVLRLTETLAELGPGSAAALRSLAEGARRETPALRADAAWLVQHGLLVNARLVPLLRVEAWLALRPGLRDVVAPCAGRLELGRARWER